MNYCKLEHPIPLDHDSIFPCVCRIIQDDTSLGRINKRSCNETALESVYIIHKISNNRPCKSDGRSVNIDYACLEVIGYPEGTYSAVMALKLMTQGYKVRHERYYPHMYFFASEGFNWRSDFKEQGTYIDWMNYVTKDLPDGWSIYIEPELKDGSYYTMFDPFGMGVYWHYTNGVLINTMDRDTQRDPKKFALTKEVSIIPNFKNVNVGDDIWFHGEGDRTINKIYNNSNGERIIEFSDSSYIYADRDLSEEGLIPHPLIFETLFQEEAYWYNQRFIMKSCVMISKDELKQAIIKTFDDCELWVCDKDQSAWKTCSMHEYNYSLASEHKNIIDQIVTEVIKRSVNEDKLKQHE